MTATPIVGILLGTAPPGHHGAPSQVTAILWLPGPRLDCKVYDYGGSCILRRLLGCSWDHKVFDFGHSFYLLPGLFALPATLKSFLCMR